MLSKEKPKYPADRHIDMTAYMGPRRAGKRDFNGKYGENTRDGDENYPSFITDDVFEAYKEAGLDILMPEADAYYGMNITDEGYVEEPDFEKSDLYAYMQMAKKHGLTVYPAVEEVFGPMTHNPGPFGKKEKEIIRDFVETVQRYFPETFGGIMLTDEPTYRSLDRVKKIVEYLHSDEIQKIKPDLRMFASMLPIYAGVRAFDKEHGEAEEITAKFFDEESVASYTQYMRQCTDAIGEFGCDYYCIGRNGWLAPGFYQNMELMAEYGKENGHEVFITLLSSRMDTEYNPKTGRGLTVFSITSYEDIRFQVYSSLAFGMRRIGYYTFWQHYHESNREVYPKAMINYDPAEEKGYRKTEIYYAVKEVNEEIRAIDHIFLHYNWQGCKVVRKSRDRNIRLVKAGYTGGCITQMEATRDLLVGCFTKDDDGTEGYWIVNAQNPYRYEMNDVRIHMEGAECVTYYRKGREYDAPLEDGWFQIRLSVGEGIFVVPYTV